MVYFKYKIARDLSLLYRVYAYNKENLTTYLNI